SAPDSDPHIPSIVDVYPTNDWHERETYDFFGRSRYPDPYLKAAFDDFRVYGRTLSGNEVATLPRN
ncbi:NADH-quinone oxidoreductase subunit C, partial [Streptomyces antimycoticus]|uniref:NADH-quinone oxidoreductase subunit C n=1 Tax=Streptomyces antimycoticus TaxID=68175 RepID=UPI00342A9AA0